MSSRSHFAAPLLLAIIVALILYVSLYPFRFGADGPAQTVQMWARVGYAPPVGPAPRRGLDAHLVTG